MKTYGRHATFKDAIQFRPDDIEEVEALHLNKLNGRIRTATRAAPSSATDTIGTDTEGDVVVDATYVYTAYSVSGTLKWDRRAHSVGW